ncbi:MAG: hypothetical protein ACJ735_16155 [Actinomycetes bacterium]
MQVATETSRVIRPAAVLNDEVARDLVAALEQQDVARGGVWNITVGLWQRYDRPWNGPGGTMGEAKLLGTIATVYAAPTKFEITIYRVTVTEYGDGAGWTVESLCDDALRPVGLTLETCPRAEMLSAPTPDPFRRAGAG